MADHSATTSSPATGVALSNGAYDKLRFSVEKVFPGLGAMYFAFSQIWHLPFGEQVVASFAALAVFGGILLSFSRKSYASSDAQYDGAVVADTTDPENPVYRLQLTAPADTVITKQQLVFKGLPPA